MILASGGLQITSGIMAESQVLASQDLQLLPQHLPLLC
jgi:hypothetical protein